MYKVGDKVILGGKGGRVVATQGFNRYQVALDNGERRLVSSDALTRVHSQVTTGVDRPDEPTETVKTLADAGVVIGAGGEEVVDALMKSAKADAALQAAADAEVQAEIDAEEAPDEAGDEVLADERSETGRERAV